MKLTLRLLDKDPLDGVTVFLEVGFALDRWITLGFRWCRLPCEIEKGTHLLGRINAWANNQGVNA